LGGQQAVISLHRLAGKNSRLQNVSVHEMGHLLGLKHCTGPKDNRCVMRDAEGSGAAVDRCSLDFCSACAKKLKP
jgi:archaemetzincin